MDVVHWYIYRSVVLIVICERVRCVLRSESSEVHSFLDDLLSFRIILQTWMFFLLRF